ncbi:Wat1-related protein [Thalictrum thalictroides]|uniref:WAT1-related protein n=1 Tax=Thalictrum thalictroides TaxID=46969 RepID=A0A7J6UZ74_THATH|nr:Wat1-related protein [Thalictrum thalictroides]
MGYDLGNTFHELKPAMMMVLVQIVSAGVTILYKLASIDGMSMKVMVAYRYLIATAFLSPLAFFLERKSRPKLTWLVVFQAFLCGLFGCSLGQNLYVASLNLTSTTFASAMSNLTPAITFIMAGAFGLEKMSMKTLGGKAKVLGTLVGIGGAMLLTVYKGRQINLWPTHMINVHDDDHISHVAKSHILGSLLALCSCFSFALWLITQTKMSEIYPCHYSSTALMCMMASIQSVIFALCMERDRSQWRLGLNIRLLAVTYSGIISSSLIVSVTTWCIHKRGPLFVSIFSPLMLVVVALAGSFLLNEKLHLGCVLGAGLIVFGLYLVLWGKSKEMKGTLQLMPTKSPKRSTETTDNIITFPSYNNNKLDATAFQPEIDLTGSEARIDSNLKERIVVSSLQVDH